MAVLCFCSTLEFHTGTVWAVQQKGELLVSGANDKLVRLGLTSEKVYNCRQFFFSRYITVPVLALRVRNVFPEVQNRFHAANFHSRVGHPSVKR